MTGRDPLLAEREKTYGSFQIQGGFAHQLKLIFREQHAYNALRDDQREALDMIATKISRLLHGNPMTKDTWDDIAGYAKLGSEACND